MSEPSPFEFQPAPWIGQGNCRGMDTNLFFPDVGENAEQAKAVCNGTLGRTLKNGTVIEPRPVCPVKDLCLKYAIDHPGRITGIWGGMSERERRAFALGQPVKATHHRNKPKVKELKVSKAIPPHGSVARYKLELSVTGQPCEACTMAMWRQQNAQAQYPELAEIVQLISEAHEQHEQD